MREMMREMMRMVLLKRSARDSLVESNVPQKNFPMEIYRAV